MSTKQAEEKPSEQKRAEQKVAAVERLESVVRTNVLSDLGNPMGAHRVQVKSVWGNFYRVNVFTGPDIASFKVAHSYFLQADLNGKILMSSPAIVKVY